MLEEGNERHGKHGQPAGSSFFLRLYQQPTNEQQVPQTLSALRNRTTAGGQTESGVTKSEAHGVQLDHAVGERRPDLFLVRRIEGLVRVVPGPRRALGPPYVTSLNNIVTSLNMIRKQRNGKRGCVHLL